MAHTYKERASRGFPHNTIHQSTLESSLSRHANLPPTLSLSLSHHSNRHIRTRQNVVSAGDCARCARGDSKGLQAALRTIESAHTRLLSALKCAPHETSAALEACEQASRAIESVQIGTRGGVTGRFRQSKEEHIEGLSLSFEF